MIWFSLLWCYTASSSAHSSVIDYPYPSSFWSFPLKFGYVPLNIGLLRVYILPELVLLILTADGTYGIFVQISKSFPPLLGLNKWLKIPGVSSPFWSFFPLCPYFQCTVCSILCEALCAVFLSSLIIPGTGAEDYLSASPASPGGWASTDQVC